MNRINSSRLIKWWKSHGRQFPWRKTRNPYRVLIAEILLHRTRAEQVVPVYSGFIRKFPDIYRLAESSEKELEETVFSLGLRWRTRLLHDMAREIMRRTGGEIPADKDWLKSLPGVSEYIASAVLCFAFSQPEPLLDTNTVRILGRLFSLPVTDGSRRSKKFRELYLSIMDRKKARIFNMAMIDLGALVCRARKPLCNECPLKCSCQYYMKLESGGKHA